MFFGTIFYLGLLHIHAMLSNPVGDDVCDFPFENFVKSMDDATTAIAAQRQNLPFSMNEIDEWVQNEKLRNNQ